MYKFHPKCNYYMEELQKIFFETKDFSKINDLIISAESFIGDKISISYLPIFSCLGKFYGILINNDPKFDTPSNKKKAFYYFRTCLDLLSSNDIKNENSPEINNLKIDVYIGYANILYACDRKIAAIRYYRNVLEIDPNHTMARANLGCALLRFIAQLEVNFTLTTNSIPDYDILYLKNTAYHYLQSGINDNNTLIYKEAKDNFLLYIKNYKLQEYPLNNVHYPQIIDNNIEENKYRHWCLDKHLFLNALNDIFEKEYFFACDKIELPSLLVKKREQPIVYTLFNQIKEEYIYSRYILYTSSIKNIHSHFADKYTLLIHDEYNYSIRLEELKTCFRRLYSIFDKIAFFINIYWNLGIKEQDISFKSIWFKKHTGKKSYSYKNILHSNSSALTALKWINADFQDSFSENSKPRYKKINLLRNALEHKFINIHSEFNVDIYQDENYNIYHISEDILYQYTLDLMYIVREAIIELTLAVKYEEVIKLRSKTTFNNIKNIPLKEYKDYNKL